MIKQYPDESGHFDVDKTYQSFRRKYYWPKHVHISKCILCNERNLKKSRPPLKTTEVPPYPQQDDQNPNSSAPMESDGANPVEDSLESDPDDNLPLAQLVRRNKRQRSGTSEEEEIPEFELRKRLKRRAERLVEINAVVWV